LIWAARDERSKHHFDYEIMKRLAGGKQMRSVWPDIAPSDEPHDIWAIGTPGGDEKKFGKHPTQKPLALLDRIILASTKPGDLVLDPFSGSATTGVAAAKLGRRYVGIEADEEFLRVSTKRLDEALDRAGQREMLLSV
jgi:site-specific DNA-methyltransferase (adenine-specific)